jgi:hypothetical protein
VPKKLPTTMSSSCADAMSKLEQKVHNDTPSVIDKSELEANRCENLAQVALMDSPSNYSKSRNSLGSKFERSKGENE